MLNHCVDCSDVNGILIAVLGKISQFMNLNYFYASINTLVILDAAFISVLVYKDVKFTALLFPIIYFINVRSVTCGNGQCIMLYVLYLQMISYVGENFPTSYDQVGKYVSVASQTPASKYISLFHISLFI